MAWELLLRITNVAEEPDLGNLGAGDLETFVHVQALPFAAQIEQEIRQNPRLRTAFKSVYIGSSTPAAIGRAFNNALRESGIADKDIIDWWSEKSGA